MKILMLGRIELLTQGGGDKVQVKNTAEELRKLGAKVDIKTGLHFDPESYDLVHIFQLDWTPETFLYAKKVKTANKPIVLSPIHHCLTEVKKFDDTYAFDFRRISKIFFKDQFKRDTFKNVYRSIFNPKKFGPTFYSIIHGFKRMQKETLQMADAVLVQTNKEAEDLRRTFGVPIKWVKIPNGVSACFINTGDFSNNLGIEDYVISVGRIEPRKNQLTIIKAIKKLREETGRDIKLLFIGGMQKLKHFEYTYYFKKELKNNPWIVHIDSVPYSDMPSYYHFAKVCVSASWFETTGLTSLEALLCGTNAVASGDRAKEYLLSNASYCSPEDVNSIEAAIKEEYFAPRPLIADEIRKEYTWSNAAAKTFAVYRSILGD
jgi:glycosyltransferase involved in cell wall biosynthesis